MLYHARQICGNAAPTLALLISATILVSCGGDSTGPESTAGLPAPGRWDGRTFDSHPVPFSQSVGATGMFYLDSVWHVIEGDGDTRLFVATHTVDAGIEFSTDTIDGRFVRAGDDGAIQLLYAPASGDRDPYPPSPVTMKGDTITVEDGVTHLIDVYVRRR